MAKKFQIEKPPDDEKALKNWKRWKQAFDLYSEASGLANKDKETQAKAIMNILGDDVINRFNNMKISDEDRKDPSKVLLLFEHDCASLGEGVIDKHVMFFTRKQKQRESFKSFLTDVTKLSRDCSFEDGLIRNAVVAGVKNKTLRKRLLRIKLLTLDKCVKICKIAEKTAMQAKDLLKTSTIVTGGALEVEKKRRRCNKCGLTRHVGNECPAFGKLCIKCKTKNHFARVCKNKTKANNDVKERGKKRNHFFCKNKANNDAEELTGDELVLDLNKMAEVARSKPAEEYRFDKKQEKTKTNQRTHFRYHMYKNKICGLMALKLCMDKSVKNFQICTNVKVVKPFDDMVIRYELDERPCTIYMRIQLREAKWNGDNQWFSNQNVGLRLEKYYDGYKKITDSQSDAFGEGFEKGRETFILFTNASLQKCDSLREQDDEIGFHNHEFLTTNSNGKIYKFTDDDTDLENMLLPTEVSRKDFLDKFLLFVQQANMKRLDEKLYGSILKLLRSKMPKSTGDSKVNEIAWKYKRFIDRKPRKKALTRIDIIGNVIEFYLETSHDSKFSQNFKVFKVLGEGAYGKVFETECVSDKRKYAVKRIKLPIEKIARERMLREVQALAHLKHRNIVRLFDAWQENYTGDDDNDDDDCSDTDDDSDSQSPNYGAADNLASDDSFIVFESNEVSDSKTIKRSQSLPSLIKNSSIKQLNRQVLYIQMELCEKQNLKDWMDRNEDRPKTKVKCMFKQIIVAVEHIHLQGFIHRDLKPTNVFFGLNGEIKVGDFGLVTQNILHDESGVQTDHATRKKTLDVGTELYMSPEQENNMPFYDYKTDIYSLGILYFELLIYFGSERERRTTLAQLREGKYPDNFENNVPDEYGLLQIMLARNPEERPTTIGIRALHPFYEKTDQKYKFKLPPRQVRSNKTSLTRHRSCYRQ